MKKALAILLAMVCCLSLMVWPVNAAEAEDIGSVEEGHVGVGTPVSNLADLNGQSGLFYLTEDIKVDETVDSFAGTLDGCGYTVTASVPMFKTLTGKVENLKIEGLVAGSSDGVGAIACMASGNKVELINISNAASIIGNGAIPVGGLIGVINGYGVVFKDIVNSGAVIGAQIIGGIFGRFNTTDAGKDPVVIENVHNTGDINTSGHRAGGIGGYINNPVTAVNISNTGVVMSNNNIAGGLFGTVTGGASSITNSVNSGDVTSVQSAGGLVGLVESDLVIASCCNSGTVLLDAAIRSWTGSGGIVGTAGYTSVLTVTNCVNVGAITAKTNGKYHLTAGGIVGSCAINYDFPKLAPAVVKIESCVNYGAITDDMHETFSVNMGGILGGSDTDTVEILNCANHGSITGSPKQSLIGGMVGEVKATVITNCINTGNLSGRQVGGVAGRANTADRLLKVNNFVNTGDITYQYGSPFIGYCAETAGNALNNCISIGNFTAGPDAKQLALYGGSATCAAPYDIFNVYTKNVTTYCVSEPAFPGFGAKDCTAMSVSELVAAANEAAAGDGYVEVNGDSIVLKNLPAIVLPTEVFSVNESADISLAKKGIRFTASFSKELVSLATYSGGGYDVKSGTFGMIIAPKSYVDGAGAATVEALDTYAASHSIAKAYLKLEPSGFVSDANKSSPYASDIWCGISNIKDAKMDFTAFAYIIVDGICYYTGNTATASLKSVATAALADPMIIWSDDQKAQLNSYIGS